MTKPEESTQGIGTFLFQRAPGISPYRMDARFYASLSTMVPCYRQKSLPLLRVGLTRNWRSSPSAVLVITQ